MKPSLILLMIGFAMYAAALTLSQMLLSTTVDTTVTRVLLSLAPMLPAIFICGVIVKALRKMDEMQRKLQFEALAMAFAGTALITFGYGFLEGAGLPRLSMFVVWPVMAALWVVGVVLGRVRYG
jgi:hypothetical protein